MTMNYYLAPTRWQRFKRAIRNQLLPGRALPDTSNTPEWSKDTITTITHLRLTLLDRIRVAFTGCVCVRTATFCQHKPGKVETIGVSFVTVKPR